MSSTSVTSPTAQYVAEEEKPHYRLPQAGRRAEGVRIMSSGSSAARGESSGDSCHRKRPQWQEHSPDCPSHVAQAGVIISGAIAESGRLFGRKRRAERKGWTGTLQAAVAAGSATPNLPRLRGGAGHPFPECERVAFAHTGQGDAKTVGMKSCEKGQRIELGANRMITTYGAGEAERLNERNAISPRWRAQRSLPTSAKSPSEARGASALSSRLLFRISDAIDGWI